MESFQTVFRSASQCVGTISPSTRISIALILLTLATAVVLIVQPTPKSRQVFLLDGHEFSKHDLTAVRAALAKVGLNDYEVQDGRVRVARNREPAFVSAIVEAGAMPRHAGYHFERIIAQDSSLFDSFRQREMRYRLAKQGELAHIIGQFPGVEYATVLIDEMKQSGFRRETTFTASVAVMPEPNRNLEVHRATSIRKLVAGSFGGLTAEHVVVVNLRTGLAYPTDQLANRENGRDVMQQRIREEEWATKLKQVLSHIPGITVVTSLSPRDLPDPRSDVMGGGEVEARGWDETLTELEFDVAADQSRPSDKPVTEGIPSSQYVDADALVTLRVAIGIPNSYYKGVWRQTHAESNSNVTRGPGVSDLEAIEAQVKRGVQESIDSLLPSSSSGQPTALVHIYSFDDVVPLANTTDWRHSVRVWLAKNWLLMTLLGLVVLSFLLSRHAFSRKNSASSDELVSIPMGQDPEDPIDARRNSALDDANVGSMEENARDRLTDIVKENPEAAAEVLRGWIGKAG